MGRRSLMCIVISGLLLTAAACNEKPSKGDKSSAEIHRKEASEAPSMAKVREDLEARGFQVFDYVDEDTGDTVLMQQYYIAFLKSGPNRSQSPEEADSLQALHMAHLSRMYKEGFADISGPFGDDGDIRGITIYNVPTLEMADSLANSDPMVKAGRLVIEVHPWWAAKGYLLR